MKGTKLYDDLMEVVVGLIYHGRLFSASKDEVVIEKSINRIFEIMRGDPYVAYLLAKSLGTYQDESTS